MCQGPRLPTYILSMVVWFQNKISGNSNLICSYVVVYGIFDFFDDIFPITNIDWLINFRSWLLNFWKKLHFQRGKNGQNLVYVIKVCPLWNFWKSSNKFTLSEDRIWITEWNFTDLQNAKSCPIFQKGENKCVSLICIRTSVFFSNNYLK